MKKTKIGMFKGMRLCAKYQKTSEVNRAILQEERLHKMVLWAKENSPYYAQHYKNIGTDFNLSDLPPTNKVELMAHWNEWITDKEISLAQVNEFMSDIDNIGRKLNGKYLVFTTSGSTGNPLVALCDSTTNNIMGAVNAVRSFARKKDMRAFIKRGAKTIGVFATGGFYLGYSSVRSRLLMMPWKKRQMAVTSALLPIPKIVEELNTFQPAMLGGYPSNLELLIDEQKSGRLHIAPVLIMTGGEYLSDALRKKLIKAFDCYVQTSYSCTEGGTIACECAEQHFHINDDFL
ncbi:MAG: phenylacetate--CoA ligase family protein, partial [Oscillospiraceae bacterium]